MEINKELGKELELELKKDGENAVICISHEGALGYIKLEAGISLADLVDKITDLIPGEMDDAILDGWAQKMLAKKSE